MLGCWIWQLELGSQWIPRELVSLLLSLSRYSFTNQVSASSGPGARLGHQGVAIGASQVLFFGGKSTPHPRFEDGTNADLFSSQATKPPPPPTRTSTSTTSEPTLSSTLSLLPPLGPTLLRVLRRLLDPEPTRLPPLRPSSSSRSSIPLLKSSLVSSLPLLPSTPLEQPKPTSSPPRSSATSSKPPRNFSQLQELNEHQQRREPPDLPSPTSDSTPPPTPELSPDSPRPREPRDQPRRRRRALEEGLDLRATTPPCLSPRPPSSLSDSEWPSDLLLSLQPLRVSFSFDVETLVTTREDGRSERSEVEEMEKEEDSFERRTMEKEEDGWMGGRRRG